MNYLCFNINDKLTFCSAGRFISKEPSVHPRRILDTAVLLFGYNGEYAISQDGNEYTLEKGTFRILFPGHEHYGTAPSQLGQSHFWCHFYLPPKYMITEDASTNNDENACILPEFGKSDDHEKFFVLFGQLINEAERITDERIRGVICDSYIKILLCSLISSSEEAKTALRGRSENAKTKGISKVQCLLRYHSRRCGKGTRLQCRSSMQANKTRQRNYAQHVS